MSVIKHSQFPRSMFDMDLWHQPIAFGPRALDVFDPFDDLDMQINNSLEWLQRPDMAFAESRVPQKYRISLDISGYNSQSIRTDIHDDKLVISGQEGQNHQENDEEYSLRKFKKTYKLPKDVETDKMASFVTKNGQLVVEFPLKHQSKEFFPQIVDDKEHGGKAVNIKLALPSHIDPSEISVTAKDHDIIIKGKHKEDTSNQHSEFSFYRRSTMPDNTDMNHLKCTLDNNQLMLNAPLLLPYKKVPIQIEEAPKTKALLHG